MMLSELQATTKPVIGTPASSYVEPELVALGIVVAAWVVLVVLLRRYDAARTANWGPAMAIRFAIGLESRYKYKDAGQGAKDPQVISSYHGVLVGSDNRTSTSKATAALWTLIVAYFFVTMALVLGFDYAKFQTLVGDTSPIYLIFLGGPFAAAVIAKAVVSGAVANGDQQRSQADAPRVADVFSDDDGNTDLVDLQYVLFNLIVAGIVLAQFLHAPGFGAPTVPSFLAGLTSASAATYVANKGLTTANRPSLDRFLPAIVRRGRTDGRPRLQPHRPGGIERAHGHRRLGGCAHRRRERCQEHAAEPRSSRLPGAAGNRAGSDPRRRAHAGTVEPRGQLGPTAGGR